MTAQADVRLLIPDTGEGEDQIFSDTQIDSFLALNDGDVRLAAADAIEVVASDEILTYKITRADDQSVNGVNGGEQLLRRAQRLREQVNADLNSAFEIFFPVQATTWPEASARPYRWV